MHVRPLLLLASAAAAAACAHPAPPSPAAGGRYGVPLHSEHVASTSADLVVQLDIPVLDALPEPAGALFNAELRQNAMDALAAMQAAAAADMPGLREAGFTRPYEIGAGYQVTFVNGRYLSMDQWISMDTGGAHPNSTLHTFTRDLGTGAAVALSDLFSSPEAGLAAVQRQVRTRLRADGFFPDVAGTWTAGEDTLFRLSADALVLTFQPYEVAPYAAGNPEVAIPWGKLPLAAGLDLPPVQRANE